MRKTFTLLCVLIISSSAYSQTKYMIYFNDKGEESKTSLKKSSEVYQSAVKELSPKAIERRKKIMGEEFITYDDLPVNQNYINRIEELGISILNKLKWFNAVSCYLNDEQLDRVKQFPFVQKIESVKILQSSKPNVKSNVIEETKPALSKTSSLNYGQSLTQNALSEIPAVHDLGITGEGVLIGILDSGFRWKTHPSLQNKNVVAEYDFIFNDSITANESEDDPNQDGHGTSVFSIMAGYDPGNLIGPAYNASFLLAKTEDIRSEKNIEEDNYAAAMEWMEAQGVDITSSSLGYSTFDAGQNNYSYSDMDGNTTIVAKSANEAFKRGVSTFTSAGNDGDKTWHYISSPADAFDIIAVGAVNSSNILSAYSSRGPTFDGRTKPEVVAMGTGVQRAVASTGSYSNLGGGTSYSAPIAAGIAGLLKSAHPHLTNAQVRKIFLESCDNSASPNNDIGYGLLSAKKAVCYPNLEMNNNEFILHKILINDTGVNSSTVTINYRIDNSAFLNSQMNFDGNYRYNFNFPVLQNGHQIDFYFTYNTLSGSEAREPFGNENYKFSYGSNQVSLITGINNVKELPHVFYLSQNYPNPFNPETTINYVITQDANYDKPAFVTLKIYDILGNEITTLVNDYQQPGEYKIQVSANEIKLSSGVYFYRLIAGKYSQTKKMLLIK